MKIEKEIDKRKESRDGPMMEEQDMKNGKRKRERSEGGKDEGDGEEEH